MQQHFLSASYYVFRVDVLRVDELTKRQEEKCCKRKCKSEVVEFSNQLRVTADEQNKIQLRIRSSVEGHIQLTAPTRKAGFAASCDFLFVKKILIFVLKFCSKLSALRVAAKRYSQC